MDIIIKNIIYQQNKIFLEKIANDNFINNDDKKKFIDKYLKYNYIEFNCKYKNLPDYLNKIR